jgi:hypothetical protein
MKITLDQLITETKGMNPVRFEAYCNSNKIKIEWMDVTINDFNDGFYNVVLPEFNFAEVFASDGSWVEITV